MPPEEPEEFRGTAVQGAMLWAPVGILLWTILIAGAWWLLT